ncbi:MAG: AraC family ligand binding domain-containing protein, partial [Kiritimatiellae bacterium]|nr:AraC family ligand binding domain-containing protein [Kiritimatiellia bacterium]
MNDQKWIELVSLGRMRGNRDYRTLRPEGREDLLFIYTLSGEGFIGKNRHPVHKGDGCLFLPNVPQAYQTGCKDHWELVWMHVILPERWRAWLNWQSLENEPGVRLSKTPFEKGFTRKWVEIKRRLGFPARLFWSKVSDDGQEWPSSG